jgi:hypothetical protein
VPPPLQVGDRVRLTPKYRGSSYRPGATGTVAKLLPPSTPGGMPLFQVRIDAGDAAFYPVLYADELERLP